MPNGLVNEHCPGEDQEHADQAQDYAQQDM